jgi:uncharacterized membrane protein YeaQ/YmgE (transglycosylase-associated protein family)
MFHLIGVIIIGFVAGLIARILSPSPNNPQGFLLTTLLGIVGAVVTNFLGTAIGLFRPDHSVGFIGATIGAVIVLAVWHHFSRRDRRLL